LLFFSKANTTQTKKPLNQAFETSGKCIKVNTGLLQNTLSTSKELGLTRNLHEKGCELSLIYTKSDKLGL